MKIFENRTYGNYDERSPVTALMTRTTTQMGNVFWLIKTPITKYGKYHDPNTFELKKGKVRVVYKYASRQFETFYVPIDPENDTVIKE